MVACLLSRVPASPSPGQQSCYRLAQASRAYSAHTEGAAPADLGGEAQPWASCPCHYSLLIVSWD